MTIQDKITKRPICSFDIEGTGCNNLSEERIVTIGIHKLDELSESSFSYNCNPGSKMSDEVIAIHHITNEQASQWSPFAEVAPLIFQVVDGCDLIGYNLMNYDVPLLWEEFYRCGILWDLSNVNIIDPGNIFKKKEERTLSAAVQFYLDCEHLGAHDALEDATATLAVLEAQLERYRDLSKLSLEELAEFSRFDQRLDLAGKIIKGKDGRPTYTLQKVRGVAVEDDPGFARWMLNKDFTANTKLVLQQVLDEIDERYALNQQQRLGELDKLTERLTGAAGEVGDADVPF